MNVYDFDGTIYNGDSTIDFFLYALKKHPSLLRCCPKQILGFILFGLKRINKRELKERFFCFLPFINVSNIVESFWDAHQNKIFDWYPPRQKESDIVISASPDFLLRPICSRLHIQHLIASQIDSHSGKFVGENCRGYEKVLRLQKEYNVTHIDEFYSDSQSDAPLAAIADKAFLVKKGIPLPWNG